MEREARFRAKRDDRPVAECLSELRADFEMKYSMIRT
jgi:hypothetical protein